MNFTRIGVYCFAVAAALALVLALAFLVSLLMDGSYYWAGFFSMMLFILFGCVCMAIPEGMKEFENADNANG